MSNSVIALIVAAVVLFVVPFVAQVIANYRSGGRLWRNPFGLGAFAFGSPFLAVTVVACGVAVLGGILAAGADKVQAGAMRVMRWLADATVEHAIEVSEAIDDSIQYTEAQGE